MTTNTSILVLGAKPLSIEEFKGVIIGKQHITLDENILSQIKENHAKYNTRDVKKSDAPQDMKSGGEFLTHGGEISIPNTQASRAIILLRLYSLFHAKSGCDPTLLESYTNLLNTMDSIKASNVQLSNPIQQSVLYMPIMDLHRYIFTQNPNIMANTSQIDVLCSKDCEYAARLLSVLSKCDTLYRSILCNIATAVEALLIAPDAVEMQLNKLIPNILENDNSGVLECKNIVYLLLHDYKLQQQRRSVEKSMDDIQCIALNIIACANLKDIYQRALNYMEIQFKSKTSLRSNATGNICGLDLCDPLHPLSGILEIFYKQLSISYKQMMQLNTALYKKIHEDTQPIKAASIPNLPLFNKALLTPDTLKCIPEDIKSDILDHLQHALRVTASTINDHVTLKNDIDFDKSKAYNSDELLGSIETLYALIENALHNQQLMLLLSIEQADLQLVVDAISKLKKGKKKISTKVAISKGTRIYVDLMKDVIQCVGANLDHSTLDTLWETNITALHASSQGSDDINTILTNTINSNGATTENTTSDIIDPVVLEHVSQSLYFILSPWLFNPMYHNHVCLTNYLSLSPFSQSMDSLLIPSNHLLRIPKVAKGTQDFEPEKMIIREIVKQKIEHVFTLHSGQPIDTPVFELRETLMGKYGQDSKLIYDLKDQGGEQLSLRYDLTVPFARYLAAHNLNKMKRYHIGKVYRRDEPQMQKGRFREFFQCDFDIAGDYPKMMPDAEILCMLYDILNRLKPVIGTFEIKINHRLFLDGLLLDIAEIPQQLFCASCSAIDKLDKEPWSVVQEELLQKGVSQKSIDMVHLYVFKRNTVEQMIDFISKDSRLLSSAKVLQALEDFKILNTYIKALGVDHSIMMDFSLARGLDYYTGLIFEAVLIDRGDAKQVENNNSDNPIVKSSSIAGGGRYDHLVGMFSGKDVPSVGFSVGIERLFKLVEDQFVKRMTDGNSDNADIHLRKDFTDVLVGSIGNNMTPVAMQITRLLWDNDIHAEFYYFDGSKLRKQLDTASSRKIPLVVICGESEYAENCVNLKQLSFNESVSDTPSEVKVPISELTSVLKERLKVSTKERLSLGLFGEM